MTPISLLCVFSLVLLLCVVLYITTAKPSSWISAKLQELSDMITSGEHIPTMGQGDKPSIVASKEGYDSINTAYWPRAYYAEKGAWPPGILNRYNHWSPGYSMGTGWSYALRPGISHNDYLDLPHHRWVRSANVGDGSYYYVYNMN